MSNYRGQDGWVQLDAAVIGEMKSFDISLRQDSLDCTVMPMAWKHVRGGLKHGTGRASLHFDYGEPSQQALIDNVILGTGLTIGPAGFYTDDGKFISGNILVTEASPKASTTTLFLMDITFEFDNDVTITWA